MTTPADTGPPEQTPPVLTWFHSTGQEVRLGAWNISFLPAVVVGGFIALWNWLIWSMALLPDLIQWWRTGALPASFHRFNGHPSAPFWPILVATLMVAASFASVWMILKLWIGTVEIVVRDGEGTVVERVGPFRRRATFSLEAVSSVTIRRRRGYRSSYSVGRITLHDREALEFAGFMPHQRLEYLVQQLRPLVATR